MRKKRLAEILGLMRQYGLEEIEVKWLFGLVKIRLVKSPVRVLRPETAPKPVLPPEKKLIDLVSPSVGAFHFTNPEEPGSQPGAEKGAKIKMGQVIGFIEALNHFTPVISPAAGEITEVLIKNKQPVEFDQLLLRLKPE